MDVISNNDDLKYQGRKRQKGARICAVPSELANRWIEQGFAKPASARKETATNKTKASRETAVDESKTKNIDKPTMDNLKSEIQDYCDKSGIDYSGSDTKAELLGKISEKE